MGRLTNILAEAAGELLARLAGRLPQRQFLRCLRLTFQRRTQAGPPEQVLPELFAAADLVNAQVAAAATRRENGRHPKHRLFNYAAFFCARLGPDDRVLDIGCGRGEVAREVARQCGACVVGIERNAERLADARRLAAAQPELRLEFRDGDVLAQPPEGTFTCAILSNVLEHLPERADFLRRLRNQNGIPRFLLRVPRFDRDWQTPLRRELGVEWRLDAEHELEYTEPVLRAELAASGLKISHLESAWGEFWVEAVV